MPHGAGHGPAPRGRTATPHPSAGGLPVVSLVAAAVAASLPAASAAAAAAAAGSTPSACQGDLALHTSLAGVESSWWKSAAQVDAATLPVPTSGPYADPVHRGRVITRRDGVAPAEDSTGGMVYRGALRIRFVFDENPLFTCLPGGATRATNFDGASTNACGAADVLTAEKRAVLRAVAEEVGAELGQMLRAVRTYSEGDGRVRLPVEVAKCNIRGLEEPFSFDFPWEGYEADLVVYVVASPIGYDVAKKTVDGTVRHVVNVHALGWPCYFAPHSRRPVVGLVNYSPAKLLSVSRDYAKRVFLHEMLHVLGWHPSLLVPPDGAPTDAPVYWSNIAADFTDTGEEVQVVRSKTFEEVFRQKMRSVGGRRLPDWTPDVPQYQTVMATPHLLRTAQAFYGCPSLAGVEVEDFTYGLPQPTRYTVHFEKRVASGDVSNSRVERTAVLSELSLALLLDSGYYNLTDDFWAFAVDAASGVDGNGNATAPAIDPAAALLSLPAWKTRHAAASRFPLATRQPLQYGRGAGCALHDVNCGLWHFLPATSPLREYTCLDRFGRAHPSRLRSFNTTTPALRCGGANNTECLRFCAPDVLSPARVLACSGEGRNASALEAAAGTSKGRGTPEEYVDYRTHVNVTVVNNDQFRENDAAVFVEAPAGDVLMDFSARVADGAAPVGGADGFFQLYGSFAEARSYSGCDPLMDYCFAWKEQEACASRTSSPLPEEDCSSAPCTVYNAPSAESLCLASDLSQAWVGTQPWHAELRSAACLPVTCFRSVFNRTALAVRLGLGRVVCHAKGELVGPSSGGGGGGGGALNEAFHTFYPRSLSRLSGSVLCPDPEVACVGRTLYATVDGDSLGGRTPPPSVTPPAAPDTPAPAAPVAVALTAVRVNGVAPCRVGAAGDWAGVSDPCDFAVFWDAAGVQNTVDVTLEGGPFHAASLWVGVGRDRECAWSGATRWATDLGTGDAGQASFRGVLPAWLRLAGAPAYLCVRSAAGVAASLTLRTTLRRVRFVAAQPGRVELARVFGGGLRIPVRAGDVVPFAATVAVGLDGWVAAAAAAAGVGSGRRVFFTVRAEAAETRYVVKAHTTAREVVTNLSPVAPGTHGRRGGTVRYSVDVFYHDGERMSRSVYTDGVDVAVGGFDRVFEGFVAGTAGSVANPFHDAAAALEAYVAAAEATAATEGLLGTSEEAYSLLDSVARATIQCREALDVYKASLVDDAAAAARIAAETGRPAFAAEATAAHAAFTGTQEPRMVASVVASLHTLVRVYAASEAEVLRRPCRLLVLLTHRLGPLASSPASFAELTAVLAAVLRNSATFLAKRNLVAPFAFDAEAALAPAVAPVLDNLATGLMLGAGAWPPPAPQEATSSLLAAIDAFLRLSITSNVLALRARLEAEQHRVFPPPASAPLPPPPPPSRTSAGTSTEEAFVVQARVFRSYLVAMLAYGRYPEAYSLLSGVRFTGLGSGAAAAEKAQNGNGTRASTLLTTAVTSLDARLFAHDAGMLPQNRTHGRYPLGDLLASPPLVVAVGRDKASSASVAAVTARRRAVSAQTDAEAAADAAADSQYAQEEGFMVTLDFHTDLWNVRFPTKAACLCTRQPCAGPQHLSRFVLRRRRGGGSWADTPALAVRVEGYEAGARLVHDTTQTKARLVAVGAQDSFLRDAEFCARRAFWSDWGSLGLYMAAAFDGGSAAVAAEPQHRDADQLAELVLLDAAAARGAPLRLGLHFAARVVLHYGAPSDPASLVSVEEPPSLPLGFDGDEATAYVRRVPSEGAAHHTSLVLRANGSDALLALGSYRLVFPQTHAYRTAVAWVVEGTNATHLDALFNGSVGATSLSEAAVAAGARWTRLSIVPSRADTPPAVGGVAYGEVAAPAGTRWPPCRFVRLRVLEKRRTRVSYTVDGRQGLYEALFNASSAEGVAGEAEGSGGAGELAPLFHHAAYALFVRSGAVPQVVRIEDRSFFSLTAAFESVSPEGRIIIRGVLVVVVVYIVVLVITGYVDLRSDFAETIRHRREGKNAQALARAVASLVRAEAEATDAKRRPPSSSASPRSSSKRSPSPRASPRHAAGAASPRHAASPLSRLAPPAGLRNLLKAADETAQVRAADASRPAASPPLPPAPPQERSSASVTPVASGRPGTMDASLGSGGGGGGDDARSGGTAAAAPRSSPASPSALVSPKKAGVLHPPCLARQRFRSDPVVPAGGGVVGRRNGSSTCGATDAMRAASSAVRPLNPYPPPAPSAPPPPPRKESQDNRAPSRGSERGRAQSRRSTIAQEEGAAASTRDWTLPWFENGGCLAEKQARVRVTEDCPSDGAEGAVGGAERRALWFAWLGETLGDYASYATRDGHVALAALYRRPHSPESTAAMIATAVTAAVTLWFFAVVFFSEDELLPVGAQRRERGWIVLVVCSACASVALVPVTGALRAIYKRSEAGRTVAESVDVRPDRLADRPLIGELTVTIDAARDLPAVTCPTQSNTLFTVEWEARKYTSATKKATLHPSWTPECDSITFPVRAVHGASVFVGVYAERPIDHTAPTDPADSTLTKIATLSVSLTDALPGLAEATRAYAPGSTRGAAPPKEFFGGTFACLPHFQATHWYPVPVAPAFAALVPYGGVPRLRCTLELRLYRRPVVSIPAACLPRLHAPRVPLSARLAGAAGGGGGTAPPRRRGYDDKLYYDFDPNEGLPYVNGQTVSHTGEGTLGGNGAMRDSLAVSLAHQRRASSHTLRKQGGGSRVCGRVVSAGGTEQTFADVFLKVHGVPSAGDSGGIGVGALFGSSAGTRTQRRKVKWAEELFTNIDTLHYVDVMRQGHGSVAGITAVHSQEAEDPAAEGCCRPALQNLLRGPFATALVLLFCVHGVLLGVCIALSDHNNGRSTSFLSYDQIDEGRLYDFTSAAVSPAVSAAAAAAAAATNTTMADASATPVPTQAPSNTTQKAAYAVLFVLSFFSTSSLAFLSPPRGVLCGLAATLCMVLSSVNLHASYIFGAACAFFATSVAIGSWHWAVSPVVFAACFNFVASSTLVITAAAPFAVIVIACVVLTAVWVLVYAGSALVFKGHYAYTPYTVFGFLYPMAFLVLLSDGVSWNDKDVSSTLVTRVPLFLFVVYMLMLIVVHLSLRGYILPQVVPPWARSVAFATALLYQALMLFFCLSYVADATSQTTAFPILNAALYSLFQHMFIAEWVVAAVTLYGMRLAESVAHSRVTGSAIAYVFEALWLHDFLSAYE